MHYNCSERNTSSGQPTGPTKQNTYRMDPSGATFVPRTVEALMRDIIDDTLRDKRYDVVETAKLSVHLSNRIHDAIKTQGYDRYKLVCHVVLGELKSQGLTSSSRALWNDGVDNYACCHYQNDYLFAIATTHAVYYE